jgi:hypothetical protein
MDEDLEKKMDRVLIGVCFLTAIGGAVLGNFAKPYIDQFIGYAIEQLKEDYEDSRQKIFNRDNFGDENIYTLSFID